MDIDKFVANFADQLDDTDIATINSETKFRELDEWDSLTSLSIIAMVDEEYNAKLSGQDFRDSKTIGDLFELVKSRSNH